MVSEMATSKASAAGRRAPRAPTAPAAIDPTCGAFQAAIDVLGRPWNGLILGVLHGGALRFTELRDHAAGPGDKVLSARLKDLEGRGLLVRRVEPGPPVRVAYELTARGRAFGRVAEAIERWGRELIGGGGSAPPARRRPRPRRARRHVTGRS